MNGGALLRRTELWTAGILLAMAAGSVILGAGSLTFGVIAGGVVGWLNVEVIVRMVGWFARASEQQRMLLALLLPLKLLIVGALVYVLVAVVGVSAVGFLGGVAGALLGLVAASRGMTRPGQQERESPE